MSTIVTRAGKGSPLTHAEVDANFTNLDTDKLEVGAAFNAAVAATPAVTANTAKVTNATHTGDVTGATALTIANDAVTNAKAADMASNTIKGRATAGTGDPEDLTGAQATALLDTFTSGAKGLVPASGGGTTNFLRADGTFAAPPGGGGSPGGSSGEVQYNNAGAFAGAADVEIEGGQLRLPAISTPSAPAADGVKLFGKRTGRVLPAFIGENDIERYVQPLLSRSHVAEWYPQGGNTTVINLGLSPAFTGTATTQACATTSFYTMCKRIGYLVTTPSTTAVANWRAASRLWTIGGTRSGEGGFTMTLRFGCSTGVSTATTRLFAGMRFDGNSATDVNPSSVSNIVCFGWDSGDANCQMIHRGAGAATKIDLGSSFSRPSVDNTDVFEVTLYSPPGTTQEVYYEVKRLNTGAVASGLINTNLPSASVFGNPHIYMSVGGTSSVIGLSIMKVRVESNY